jgi:hypothetical protein
MALVIYNDRITTYKKMKVLDAELDQSPTEEKVKDLAELRIRNLQCFAELKSLNNTGRFRFDHPLLEHYNEKNELKELHDTNPMEFLKQYANCKNNIIRYRGYLKRKDRKEKTTSDKAHLTRWKSLEQVFKIIMEEANDE